jgi:hypothetical protein
MFLPMTFWKITIAEILICLNFGVGFFSNSIPPFFCTAHCLFTPLYSPRQTCTSLYLVLKAVLCYPGGAGFWNSTQHRHYRTEIKFVNRSINWHSLFQSSKFLILLVINTSCNELQTNSSNVIKYPCIWNELQQN